ncbi:MAG TPA: hypothetical protein PLE95_10945, partial [Bacteroidales bacterium]|nr:hypothetical protein [Bacteroidales bacterium]
MNSILVKLAFVLLVTSPSEERQAHFLIQSIRDFGGTYSRNPVYIFVTDTTYFSDSSVNEENTFVMPLGINPDVPQYPFFEKVHACARAEEILKNKAEVLVWIDVDALVVSEPGEFILKKGRKIAIRPVNLKNNVGLPAGEPANPYWQKIYSLTGLKANKIPVVETLVDNEKVRSYLNCAVFSVRPELGIMNEWKNMFMVLVNDREYQDSACRTYNQKLFLHQSVLSAVIASRIKKDEIQWFTCKAGYPLHHHNQLSPGEQARQLNELESFVYERLWDTPGGLQQVIQVNEPLISWLHNADTTGDYIKVKHAIEQSIGWAVEKDFEALYSLWADNMFHFWLTSGSKII